MAETAAALRLRRRRRGARLALAVEVAAGVALVVGLASAAGGALAAGGAVGPASPPVSGMAGAARPVPTASPLPATDPALEARVMRLAEELRCLVCQNESLAGSQSALAIDLRGQIREQLAGGRTPQQVTDFMVERYGEFIRFRPAFSAVTVPLWLGPFALLALAGGVLAAALRRQRRATKGSLDEAQARRADELLEATGPTERSASLTAAVSGPAAGAASPRYPGAEPAPP